MAKPSKSHFNEWFDLEAQRPAYELFEGLELDLQKTENPKKVLRERLEEARERLVENYRKAHNSQLLRWAKKQPGYQRAVQDLNKRRRKKEDGFQEQAGDTFDRFVALYNPHDLHEFHLIVGNYFRSSVVGTWNSRLFHALHEYLYTDNSVRLYEMRRDSGKVFGALRRALADAIELMEEVEKEVHHVKGLKAAQRLEIGYFEDAVATLPIQRDSQHKAEQLFVHRLWRANSQWTGTAKPEVIVELMTMDGFEHQFDLRTVGRLCARLKAAKAAKTYWKY